MRVYISADMEGITGQVSWDACGSPDGQHYDFAFARRMMTGDVNAAIRGARAAGATRVVVKDSHGTSRNLLLDDLEPGTELISGEAARIGGMVAGIEEGFDAAMLVGYHGMAGSKAGVMEHTITGQVHRLWWNELELGEIGISTATASHVGVPMCMISSDEVGCAELASLVPGVATAVTKYGIGRYMARCLHPSVTWPAIEKAAFDGVQKAPSLPLWKPSFPVLAKLEFNRGELADYASRMPGTSRVDQYTVSYEAPNLPELHRAMRTLMSLGRPS